MIPTKPRDCTELIPTDQCPPVEPVEYTAILAGGWLEGAEESGPTLQVTTADDGGSLDPAPPGDGVLHATLAFAVALEPIVGEPTLDDVPATFQVMNVYESPGIIGLQVPLFVVGLFIPAGAPCWVSLTYTDRDGGETTAYVFFPEGLQPEPTDLQLFVLLDAANGGDGDPIEVNVVAPEEPGEAGPPIEPLEIVSTPVYPEPARFVPVGPNACGLPIPVTFTASDEPTEVTGIDGDPVVVEGEVTLAAGATVALAAGSTVDLAPGAEVTIDGDVEVGPDLEAVIVTQASGPIAPGDPDWVSAVPAGWKRLELYGQCDTSGVGFNVRMQGPVERWAVEVPAGTVDAKRRRLTYEAPEGLRMPAGTSVVATNGTADGAEASWTA